MKYINISDEACKEFKDFLAENNVDNYNIRINLAGYGCSGPVFNISVSEVREEDISEVVNDITFIAEKTLILYEPNGLCSSDEIYCTRVTGSLSLEEKKEIVDKLLGYINSRI